MPQKFLWIFKLIWLLLFCLLKKFRVFFLGWVACQLFDYKHQLRAGYVTLECCHCCFCSVAVVVAVVVVLLLLFLFFFSVWWGWTCGPMTKPILSVSFFLLLSLSLPPVIFHVTVPLTYPGCCSLGTCVSNSSDNSASVLYIEFDSYTLPVVFPTELHGKHHLVLSFTVHSNSNNNNNNFMYEWTVTIQCNQIFLCISFLLFSCWLAFLFVSLEMEEAAPPPVTVTAVGDQMGSMARRGGTVLVNKAK